MRPHRMAFLYSSSASFSVPGRRKAAKASGDSDIRPMMYRCVMAMLGTLPDMCPIIMAICSMATPLRARLVAKERRPVCVDTNSYLRPRRSRPAWNTFAMESMPHARHMSRMLLLYDMTDSVSGSRGDVRSRYWRSHGWTGTVTSDRVLTDT